MESTGYCGAFARAHRGLIFPSAMARTPPATIAKGFAFSSFLYRYRNLVERFFGRLKNARGLAAIKLFCTRLWIAANESGSDRDSPDIDRSEQFPLSRGRKVKRAIGPQVVLKFVLESKSKSCGYWSALDSWGKPWRAFACLRREKRKPLAREANWIHKMNWPGSVVALPGRIENPGLQPASHSTMPHHR
jgi:hypothetical protein